MNQRESPATSLRSPVRVDDEFEVSGVHEPSCLRSKDHQLGATGLGAIELGLEQRAGPGIQLAGRSDHRCAPAAADIEAKARWRAAYGSAMSVIAATLIRASQPAQSGSVRSSRQSARRRSPPCWRGDAGARQGTRSWRDGQYREKLNSGTRRDRPLSRRRTRCRAGDGFPGGRTGLKASGPLAAGSRPTRLRRNIGVVDRRVSLSLPVDRDRYPHPGAGEVAGPGGLGEPSHDEAAGGVHADGEHRGPATEVLDSRARDEICRLHGSSCWVITDLSGARRRAVSPSVCPRAASCLDGPGPAMA